MDYTASDADPDGELITVITTVVEPGRLSAVEMTGSYAQRAEHETVLGEVKRQMIGPGQVLSSQSPPMVYAQL